MDGIDSNIISSFFNSLSRVKNGVQLVISLFDSTNIKNEYGGDNSCQETRLIWE